MRQLNREVQDSLLEVMEDRERTKIHEVSVETERRRFQFSNFSIFCSLTSLQYTHHSSFIIYV